MKEQDLGVKMIEFLVACFVIWSILCLMFGIATLITNSSKDLEFFRVSILLPLLIPIWTPYLVVQIIYEVFLWLYQGFVRYLPWK